MKKKISNISAELKELKRKKTNIENHISDEKEKARRLGDKIQNILGGCTLQEIVGLVDEKIRPIVLPVEMEGINISLVQLKGAPDHAVLLWNYHGGHSTQWKVAFRLSGGFVSENFYLPCSCCLISQLPEIKNFNKQGASDIEKEEFEQKDKELKVSLRLCFKEQVNKICSEQGIRFIAMRRADEWKDLFGRIQGVRMIELSELKKSLSDWYGETDCLPSLAGLGANKLLF